MATYTEVETAILEHFKTVWQAPFKGEIPDYVIANQKDGATCPWARITINPTGSTNLTIGSPRTFQRDGNIIIQIYVKDGTGIKDLNLLTDRVVEGFEARSIEPAGVDLRDVLPVTIGPSPLGYQRNVRVEFRWYEDK